MNKKWFLILCMLICTIAVSSCAGVSAETGSADNENILKSPVTGLTAEETYDHVREIIKSSSDLYYPEMKSVSEGERKAFLDEFLSGDNIKVINFDQVIQKYDDPAAEDLKNCTYTYNGKKYPFKEHNILWSQAEKYYGPYRGPFVTYRLDHDNMQFVVLEKYNLIPLDILKKQTDHKNGDIWRLDDFNLLKLPFSRYTCAPVDGGTLAFCGGGNGACEYPTYAGLIIYKNNYFHYILYHLGPYDLKAAPQTYDFKIHKLVFGSEDTSREYFYRGHYGKIY